MKWTVRDVVGYSLVALGVIGGLLMLSLTVGSFPLDWEQALSGEENNPHRAVLLERLFRSILALSVGAILSLVGTLFQALTRNPLADPFLLGVSGGAAVGATLAITLGGALGLATLFTLPLQTVCAFGGAVLFLVGVVRIATERGSLSVHRLLLAGVVLNFLASAIVMVLKTFGGATEVRMLLLWLVGTLSWANHWEIALCASAAVLGSFFSLRWLAALNVVALGDEGAQLMGVSLPRVQKEIFGVSSLLVGVAVSASGLIGFVGLIVPHGIRHWIGADHRIVLPMSILVGGGFLLACDLIARALFPVLGTDAPVGVVTSLVGGPVFLWMLMGEKGGNHGS